MFIFAGYYVKTVIPSNRIYDIKLIGKNITINYDNGELSFLDDSCAAVAPKIASLTLTYDKEEAAVEVMRKFYKACSEKAGVFKF